MSETNEEIGLIDIGMSFQAAEDASKNKLLKENKVYTGRVAGVTKTEVKATGRPRLIYQVEVFGDDEMNGEKLSYGISLPWNDPAAGGKFNDKGINFWVALCKGAGYVWAGSTIDPKAPMGAEIKFEVKNKPDQDGNPRSEIKKIYPKA